MTQCVQNQREHVLSIDVNQSRGHVRYRDVDDRQVDHQSIIDRHDQLFPFQAHDENDVDDVRNQDLSRSARLRGKHDVIVLKSQAATLVKYHLGVRHVSICSISLIETETDTMMLKKLQYFKMPHLTSQVDDD